MIVHVSFWSSLSFRRIQKVIFSPGIQTVKDLHCAPVLNADDVAEPRLTLKQIERKKLERRSECTLLREVVYIVSIYHDTSPLASLTNFSAMILS